MQIFIHCRVTLHVSGVTAPIIKSTKNRNPASNTGHNIGWREVAVPILWPEQEAAVTAFSTPDDGCCDTRNMYSDFAGNKYLHTVASGWIFINIEFSKAYVTECLTKLLRSVLGLFSASSLYLLIFMLKLDTSSVWESDWRDQTHIHTRRCLKRSVINGATPQDLSQLSLQIICFWK